MMNMYPHAHLRSLPPEGAAVSFGAARQETDSGPRARVCSLPPEGAAVSLGAARQETACC